MLWKQRCRGDCQWLHCEQKTRNSQQCIEAGDTIALQVSLWLQVKTLQPLPSLTVLLSGLQVSLLIRRELFERAKDFNIILDDVAITELSFSREYTAAVEAKQVGKYGSLVPPAGGDNCPFINPALTGALPQPSRRRSELSSMWRKPSKTRDRRSSRLKEKLRLPKWWVEVTGFTDFTGFTSAFSTLSVCLCVVRRGSDQEPRLPEAQKNPRSPEHCQDGKTLSCWLRLLLTSSVTK